MTYIVFLSIIAAVLASVTFLYIVSLYFAFGGRNSKPFSSAFFKIWWNGVSSAWKIITELLLKTTYPYVTLSLFQGIMDVSAIVFYSLTMYPRCFYSTSSFFLSLNQFTWLTKFAFISQEHFLYMQLTNILITILCRTLSVGFTSTKITTVSLKIFCFNCLCLL